MDTKIKDLLDAEIVSEIEKLPELPSGEKTAAISNLVKLYEQRIEETKVELDAEEKREKRTMEAIEAEREDLLKRDQLKEQVKDRYFKVGVEIVGIVLPLIFYAVWMGKGFKFEETGTFTSTTFRGLFNRFRPTN